MSTPKSAKADTSTVIHQSDAVIAPQSVSEEDKAIITQWITDNNISEIECIVPDTTGNARGKFIPAHQFIAQLEQRLPEAILVQTVTGEYTDEHWDFVEPSDTDMVLSPDASTLRVVPLPTRACSPWWRPRWNFI